VTPSNQDFASRPESGYAPSASLADNSRCLDEAFNAVRQACFATLDPLAQWRPIHDGYRFGWGYPI
jgi:hypothetical protein